MPVGPATEPDGVVPVGPASEPDGVVPVGPASEPDGVVPVDPAAEPDASKAGVAHATPADHEKEIADPMPKTTAKAPTRPT
ncbi:hypothetical protein [Mycolicibacterium moriokaense]|uniref:Uncharacterized protein n=1 Tax=Mycolicibacterium moriokaense TaxID=39691 RepID=A0A318H2X4_9MYCO|nr:hypothetical protein [Mycolicibacterium moriokaense]PXW97680.1 hypothetical protein C8E89_14718 [Mycolicibacterium moriokaense]